jgi:hypothetical protein
MLLTTRSAHLHDLAAQLFREVVVQRLLAKVAEMVRKEPIPDPFLKVLDLREDSLPLGFILFV